MAVLLVDDRDGRVLAQIEDPAIAQRILEAWATDDGTIPDYLCIVESGSRHGSILGVDASVKVRPAFFT